VFLELSKKVNNIKKTHNTNETDFLIDLFSTLNKKNIIYCVLRNFDTLPFDLLGSDIDLFVCQENFQKFHEILESITKKYNGYVISELFSPNVKDVSLCGFYKENWWGVRFDTFTYVGTNQCSIFSNEFIISRINIYNGIKVVNKNDSYILGFIKEIIGAKKFSERYAQDAFNAYKQEQKLYDTEFLELLDKGLVNKYLIPLIKGEIGFSEKICKIIYNGFKKKYYSNKLELFISTFLNFKYKLKRLAKTPGFSIAILGTDGSGKTTIINKLIPLLEKPLHNKLYCSHMRPNMTPNIAQLFGKPFDSNLNLNPHKELTSGFFISLIRLLYYLFDYIFGYWIIVNTVLAKKTTIWFFDRYYYDYLFDQKRSCIKMPIWIIKLFGLFVPTPNLIICLGANSNLIYSRKAELPIDEIRSQIQKLKSFCSKKSNAVWIDTGNQSIESTINLAMEQIVFNMSNRYK